MNSLSRFSKCLNGLFLSPLLSATALWLAAVLSANGAAIGKTFASPEDAVGALKKALNSHDTNALVAIFGPAVDEVRSSDPMPHRLASIFETLCALLEEHRPDRVAIEDVFYAVNAKSALKLGQVRGVAMLAASTHCIDVTEYAPLSIKSAVVGYGRAEKQQVQMMVARLLGLDGLPEPADAADALAIAICDLHINGTLARQQLRAAR